MNGKIYTLAAVALLSNLALASQAARNFSICGMAGAVISGIPSRDLGAFTWVIDGRNERFFYRVEALPGGTARFLFDANGQFIGVEPPPPPKGNLPPRETEAGNDTITAAKTKNQEFNLEGNTVKAGSLKLAEGDDIIRMIYVTDVDGTIHLTQHGGAPIEAKKIRFIPDPSHVFRSLDVIFER